MVQQFITRPVLSIVVSIFIVILGVIAMQQLPITQFPDIVPPAVTVTTKYTGANAEVCAKAVVTPLERAINGVAGMTYMTSVSGNDGTSIIQVYFQVGTDPDVAAVNVQTRVQTVLDELPEEVIKAGVITEKEVNSMLLYVNLLSEDADIDEKFIYNFADINVLPELKELMGWGLRISWAKGNMRCVSGCIQIACLPISFQLRTLFKLCVIKMWRLLQVKLEKVRVNIHRHYNM